MLNKKARIDFCEGALEALSGIDGDGDLEKLAHVFLLFPWESDATRAEWCSILFKDRPGDLLRVMSYFRVWKETGLDSKLHLDD